MKIMETSNPLTSDWLAIATLTQNEEQANFFRKMAADAHEVKVETLESVVGKKRAVELIRSVRPQKHECYKNATLLSLVDPAIKYVEGRVLVCGIPIDHAFNVIDGHYVDITTEYALKKHSKVVDDSYISIGEYETKDVMLATLETEIYGSIYQYMYMKQRMLRKII